MLCAPWPGGFCEGLILGFYCDVNMDPFSLRFGATDGPKSEGPPYHPYIMVTWLGRGAGISSKLNKSALVDSDIDVSVSGE